MKQSFKMKPFEKYLKIVSLIRKGARYCGADIMEENYKPNGLTMFLLVYIFLWFICTIYTIYLKISESWLVPLEAFCMGGSVIQGLVKLLSAIKFRHLWCAFIFETESIYREYDTKGHNYLRQLNKILTKISTSLLFIAVSYVILFFGLLSTPLIYYIYKGEKVFIMHFLIPGLDPTSDIGYLLIIFAQANCICFGTFGNFAADALFVTIAMHAELFSKILKEKVRELNENLDKCRRSEEIWNILLNIVKWHQKYIKYTANIDKAFFWVIFVQIATCGLAILLTAFIVLTGAWPAGPAYLVYSVAMLFTYCIVGTVFDIVNDEILEHIYEANWYNLHYEDQQLILVMLHNAQNVDALTVGGLMPLSVNTGLQVIKTVYSYTMMLLSFL